MSDNSGYEDRCSTCNHKREKHYWGEFPGNNCQKKNCDCEKYTMKAAEKERTFVGVVAILVCIVAIGFVVASCNGNSSGNQDCAKVLVSQGEYEYNC
jgi:hypothetical protein